MGKGNDRQHRGEWQWQRQGDEVQGNLEEIVDSEGNYRDQKNQGKILGHSVSRLKKLTFCGGHKGHWELLLWSRCLSSLQIQKLKS